MTPTRGSTSSPPRNRGPQGHVAPVARTHAPRRCAAGAGAVDEPAGAATADQLLSFAGVGLLSTLSYLLLFSLGLAGRSGPGWPTRSPSPSAPLVNTALHRGTVRRRVRPDARAGHSPAQLRDGDGRPLRGQPGRHDGRTGPGLTHSAPLARRRPGRRHGGQRDGVIGALRPAAWVGLPPRAAGTVTDLIDAARSDLDAGTTCTAAPPPDRATRPADPPAAAPPLGTRLRPLLRPAGYYAGSRLLVWCAAAVAAVLYPRLDLVRTLGSIWDGRWYVLIAQHGYPQRMYQEGMGSRWAFFPAFPAAIRAVAEVTRLSLPASAVLAALGVRADGHPGHLAGCAPGPGRSGGGPCGPAVRLLPPVVHPLVRLHRGPLSHRGGRVSLRAGAAPLDHGGAPGLSGRPDPQHRHRRGAVRPRGGIAGGLALPHAEAAGRRRARPRSGWSRSWPTAGPWWARRWPS